MSSYAFSDARVVAPLCCLIATTLLAAGCASPERRMSDTELVFALAHRENQPNFVWRGASRRHLTADSYWVGGPNPLEFFGSKSRIYIEAKDRVPQKQGLPLALINSSDTETVLTGLSLYMEMPHLWTPVVGGVPDSVRLIRYRAQTHPDARVRWASLRILINLSQIEVTDIERSLADNETAVRDLATQACSDRCWRIQLLDTPESIRMRRELIAVLIRNLDHDDWYARSMAQVRLIHLVLHGVPGGKSGTDSGMPPSQNLWTVDISTAKKIRGEWEQWWSKNGDAIGSTSPQQDSGSLAVTR